MRSYENLCHLEIKVLPCLPAEIEYGVFQDKKIFVSLTRNKLSGLALTLLENKLIMDE